MTGTITEVLQAASDDELRVTTQELAVMCHVGLFHVSATTLALLARLHVTAVATQDERKGD